MKVSPLAPQTVPTMPPVKGVRMATAEAGIKYSGRSDVLLMLFDQPATIAGVFTQSMCPGAPVDWCRKNLAKKAKSVRSIMVNSGNANAFTGIKGEAATRLSAKLVSKATGHKADQIYLASTGVIGEPLDAEKFEPVLAGLVENAAPDQWHAAAEAIMTTDTFPKVATARCTIDGRRITINGIAKGSGMIAPDMATMLGFIVTDAPVAQPLLQKMLSSLTQTSFNAVTVDSDTSTSDTVLLAATGEADCPVLKSPSDPRVATFRAALEKVMHSLAMQIVRDGEGATKQVEIVVDGAKSNASARKIAQSIANSPLVKTAIAGEDANWGRIVMAVGKAGEPAKRDRLSIWFGKVRVAVNGERDPAYSETAASKVMQKDEIVIRVALGMGKGTARIWTCDLTKQYVAINGDYRS